MPSSTSAIAGLEPAALWEYFAELSRIPRESRNEQAAGELVVRVAKEFGLAHERDAAGSVVVRKPASSGREHLPSVCLQGHLDMVCVALPGKRHDFTRDPITLVHVNDEIRADGTTLGADNGIAVATCLAIMADRTLQHCPLELLFTVDEETGLTGAQQLGPGMLQSRTLINLDTEDEGVLCVGCAGGADTTATWALVREPARAGGAALELRVTGLQGGHSGVEIHTGRGNAIKMLGRVLVALEPLGARIAHLEGGSKRNAIPAEARAVFWLPRANLDAARGRIASLRDTLFAEIGTVERGLDLVAAPVTARITRVYKRSLQRQVLRTLSGLPHGVIKMSASIPGLVETSTNVAVLTQTPRALSLATSQRSMVDSEIHEAIDSVTAILELGGAKVSGRDAYPGWKPDLGSKVLATAVRTHRELYGREPRVEAVHAGLECGILGEKNPGMDMVSLGPDIRGAHSPEERVSIPSVARYWEYLLAVLGNVE